MHLPASRQHRANSAFHVIVVIAFCFITGCTHRPILVITSGGLGFSQMGDVRRAIEKQCPNADVVSAGWWDAYKSDMAQIIRDRPHDHIVLVGHSLGCQTIAQTAGKVSKVDLAVLIDPAWDDIKLPRNIQQCLWYRRSDLDGSARQTSPADRDSSPSKAATTTSPSRRNLSRRW